ncbi:transposable element Tcb2 transposase [Trichonephila clavipes]|uniref:Transposable element Tcb2 transposase n=1 Tax=Trichonephila clavipes TaxID=2585209 RepID=A0A8X6SMD4_TRICX|nr:transposable element Tcb2 transposase [Trichonephila clavipes]
MEMGCHRLMLLGILMCLVVWSTVSRINIKPKHLCPEDMFQANHELQHLQDNGGTLTGVRYRDEILDPYIHLYAGAVGNGILMDDNARPHRDILIEENLEGLGLERM